MYVSTKKYGHEKGFSCAFRQHKAYSHCHFIHGYALAFELTFECDTLDDRNWCQDFGDLGYIKDTLEYWFDHTVLVATDDPQYTLYKSMEQEGLIQMRLMPNGVGCERVAEHVYRIVSDWLFYQSRVRLRSVQVWEHPGNSARYEG